MRTFSGYTSRSSLGILADDPDSEKYNTAGQAEPARKKTGVFTPTLPENEFHEKAPRAGRRAFPALSLRVILIAAALNVLLLFGFAILVDRDIQSLPKPVYYIYLTDAPDAPPSPEAPATRSPAASPEHSEKTAPSSAAN